MLLVSGCAVLGFAAVAHADEGGSGLYIPGYLGPQAGMSPPPGTYGGYTLYLYNGSATANVSATRPVQIPGTDFTLPVQATGSVTAKTPNLDANLFVLTHVFPQTVFGGNVGLSVIMPVIDARLNVAGSGVLALTGPNGNAFNLPVGAERTATQTAYGDTEFTGLIGWHSPKVHTMLLLNVYTPTGAYNPDRVLNVGKNHWAVEPMAAVTYLDPKTRLELSADGGITFNGMNTAKQYRNGDDLHFDFAAVRHFSPKFYFGLAGYDYTQITGDSGSGAPSSFKGQVFGVGPALGGVIPLGPKHMLSYSARYYWEMGAVNRLQGQAFFLTAAVNL